MGKRYGEGRHFIGDCNDCGAEHYGYDSGEDHDDEPMCESCQRYDNQRKEKARKAKEKEDEKVRKAKEKEEFGCAE